ncbi:MAG: hypothetical protein ABSD96_16440 [Candidatus Korobacteraceae bacterium]|jgi:hypothetical protein
MPLSKSIDKVARFYWIPLVPAFLITLFYSLYSFYLGYMGIRFGSSGWRGTLVRVQHVLPFLLFLVVLVSLKLGSRLLWLWFVSDFILAAAINFSSPRYHISYHIIYFPFVFLHDFSVEWWLVVAAVLTQVAYLLRKRSQHVSREKVDRDTQVTN